MQQHKNIMKMQAAESNQKPPIQRFNTLKAGFLVSSLQVYWTFRNIQAEFCILQATFFHYISTGQFLSMILCIPVHNAALIQFTQYIELNLISHCMTLIFTDTRCIQEIRVGETISSRADPICNTILCTFQV